MYVYKENLEDGLFLMSNDLSKVNLKIECEKRRISWKEIVDRLSPYLPVYNNLQFWPDPSTLAKKTFNIWPGFQARLLKKPVEEFQNDPRLAEMKQYYRDIHCGGNETCYRHEMRIFQLLYTQPAKKKEGGIFLCSGQGTGKNTGMEFQELIFGEKLYLAGKLLVVADELGSTSEGFRPLWERLKAYTTDKKTTVNKKFVSKYSVHNVAFLFIMSNHEHTMVLDADDRRYACFEVSEVKKGDFKYWDGLRKRCFNQETADLFFSWLCKTHEFDDVDIRALPETEARTRIKERSLGSVARYLRHLKNMWSPGIREYASLSAEQQATYLKRLPRQEAEFLANSRWVQSTEFFDRYSEWASRHRETPVKFKNFTAYVSKLLDKAHKKQGQFYDLYSIKDA